MEKEGFNYTFKEFLNFIFINSRRYKDIQTSYNVDLINPTQIKDMLSLAYNSELVSEAHKHTKRDNKEEVLNTYNRLKNNIEFLKLFNLDETNNKLTLKMIIKISKSIDDVKDLNQYLGFMEKQNVESYILYSEEKIKNIKQKAILKFGEKTLKSSPKKFYQLLEENPLYNKLTDEDKEEVKKDKRLLEEVLMISSENVGEKQITETITDTITSFIELYIIGLKYNPSSIDRKDYYEHKEKYEFYKMSVDSYEFDIQTRKLEEQLRKQEEEKQEEMRRLQEINDRFNQQMEEINRRTNERMAEYVRDTYDRFMEMQRQKNYSKWFNETFKEIREEHEEIDFEELIDTFRTVINKVESLTGKKYDPETNLITKQLLYKFHNMSEQEKEDFIENLDLDSLQTSDTKK